MFIEDFYFTVEGPDATPENVHGCLERMGREYVEELARTYIDEHTDESSMVHVDWDSGFVDFLLGATYTWLESEGIDVALDVV